MVALMDGLGLQKAHIMGHSLGAAIAALFAAEHPERVDHFVLLDGAGKLNKAQTARVVAGITPSVQRLGQVYSSLEDYLSMLKKAPYLTDWTEAHEVYFRYEVEEDGGGVRTRARLEHIMEEITNLLNFEVSDYYSRIECPTLIVRACRGMLRDDDILLPPNAISRMTKSILDAWVMSLEKANHYSIVFAKNDVRDNVILNFLRS
jgi:pimeloyl-ACP methyl ester carboxylesterase